MFNYDNYKLVNSVSFNPEMAGVGAKMWVTEADESLRLPRSSTSPATINRLY